MSLIFKNGVPYGGGSGDVEISWEDYKALSDEERNNGTTYFVPDFVEEEDDDNSGSGLTIEKLSGQEIIIESDKYDSVLVVPEEEITSNTYIISTDENKNLIDNISNSETKDGISFIVNKTNGTITINGTATKYVSFMVQTFDASFKQGQKLYISSGSDDLGSLGGYISFNSIHQFGGAFEMDKTAGGTVVLSIVEGKTLNNVVVKPVMYECDYILADKTTRFPVKLKTFEGKTRIFTTSNKTLNVYKGDDEASSMLFNVIPRVEPIRVIDDLTTSSFNGALSANQGMILNQKFGGLRFGKDGDGNYGYYKGDDTFVPFKSTGLGDMLDFIRIGNLSNNNSVSFEVPKTGKYLIITRFQWSTGKFISVYDSKSSYGSRIIFNEDYSSILYNWTAAALSSLLVTRTETEYSISYTITKDSYVTGPVDLLYFPIDGSPAKVFYATMYDKIAHWRYWEEGSVKALIGKDAFISQWDGGGNLGINIYGNEKIDLTNYSKISLSVVMNSQYSKNFYTHLFVSNSVPVTDPRAAGATVKEARTNEINNMVKLELDVSDLTGSYYIGIAPIGMSGHVSGLKFE